MMLPSALRSVLSSPPSPSSIQCSIVLGAYRIFHAQRNSRDGLIHGTVKLQVDMTAAGALAIVQLMAMEKAIFRRFLNPVISAGNRGISADTELLIGGLFQMVA